MKRSIVFLSIFLILGLAAGAQELSPLSNLKVSSLESENTAGLYRNAIDNSFNFWNDFGSTDYSFIFAGLSGNPWELSNEGTKPGTLAAGFYQPGTIPFSVYLKAAAAGFTTAPKAGYTGQVYNVATGTLSTSTVYSFKQPSSLKSLDITAHGILEISGITSGLYFNSTDSWLGGTGADGSYSDYYSTAATSHYFNKSVDYIETVVNDNWTGVAPTAGDTGKNTISTSNIAYLPFALTTGSIRHYGYITGGLVKDDSSAKYSFTGSARQQFTLPNTKVNDISTTITSYTQKIPLGLCYVIDLPGLFRADKGARLTAGLSFSDTIGSQTYTYSSKSTEYDISTIGSKNPTGVTESVSESRTYNGTSAIDAQIYVDHSFPFEPVSGLKFTIKPGIQGHYSQSAENLATPVSSTTTTISTDTSNTSTTETATETYTGSSTSTKNVGFKISVPMGAEYKPEKLPFGFCAGSVIDISFDWKTVTTPDVFKTAIAVDGTKTYAFTAGSSTVALLPAFNEYHSFGLFFPFENNVRLDISLNGYSVLVWDSLTLQLIVPLK